jgi:1-deoxy-D-xylulose-5-phosphate reductoisomerase
MNKGLELIEACTLFGLDENQVEVIIHPQSVLHSVVYFTDGSLIGQMGSPDMRVPITHGLAYPDRMSSGVAGIDLTQIGQLQFELPDLERFPSLKLARQAAKEGRTAPIVLNAANEVAVQAFLGGRIEFGFIPEIVDRTLEGHEPVEVTELAQVIGIDQEARIAADDIIRRILH